MRAMPNRNVQIGSRAVIVARLTLRPVWPQLRKCRVRPGSYAWCQFRTSRPLSAGRASGAHRRIVLRCCSVPQAKPSPDCEYRISLRPHPVGHPSSSTRDSASRAVPSSIRVRRDGYREAGEWQQAGGDQRDRAAQKVFARAGSRKPRSDQHQECSTTDNLEGSVRSRDSKGRCRGAARDLIEAGLN